MTMKENLIRKNEAGAGGLLASWEPPAFTVENPKAAGSFLVVCDHASNRIPKSLESLGLTLAEISKHIGWDIGAKDLSLTIAQALDASCVLAGYSRLVIDLNRVPGHAGSILETSDRIRIPGNEALAEGARLTRLNALYHPYHDEIDRQTARISALGKTPAIIAVHSFTPEMNGQKRPWHIGVLWNGEGRIALPLIAALRADNPDLVIGDNEPYSAKDGPEFNNTIAIHALAKNLPSVMVEFRQDMVATPEGVKKMAEIFLAALGKLDASSFS